VRREKDKKNQGGQTLQKKTKHLSSNNKEFLTHFKWWRSTLLGWCQDNRNRSNQESKFDFLATRQQLRWCQDNRNRSNQESKFDFLATRQKLGKIDGEQQKLKIVRTNRQSNLRGSANQFSPSASTLANN